MPPEREAADAGSTPWDTSRAWWIAAAATVALGLFHAFLYLRVTVDDAYIFCRYAENFAEGHGLVYNPGERTDGYTSFLWVTLLSVAVKLGFGAVAISKGMGLAFHFAAQGTLLCILREIPFANRWIALAAPLLLASSAAFAYETVAGLETQLFVFLLLATVHTVLQSSRTGRGDLIWAGFASLLTLARPDGILFFPLFLFWRSVGRDRLAQPRLSVLRAVLGPTVVFLALVGGWWVARFAYYGQPLPNSFYVKAPLSPFALIREGSYRALGFLDENGGYLFAGLVGFALVGWRAEPWKVFAFFAIAARLFLQVWSGGPVMGHHRFLVPALPFAVLLFVKAVDEIRAFLGSRLLFREDRGLLALVAGGILLVSAANGWKVSLRQVRPKALRYMELEEKAHVRMGVWLAENAAPDAVILCCEAGALPYWSRRKSIDWGGLTDKFIARTQREGAPGWEERFAHHLFKERPSYVVIPSARADVCEPYFSVGKALVASQELTEEYTPMSVLSRDQETEYWLFTYRRNDLVHDDPPGKIQRREGL